MTTQSALNTAPRTASLAERWHALRRRTAPMAVAAAGILVCTTLAAFLWPASYKSYGTILIEQQELPMDLVRSTISSFADQRLQVIKQRVMTTENLLRIIERYELYADLRKRKSREVVVDRMRSDIRFDLIRADVIDPRSGHPTSATIAFSVSYINRSPDVAAKVANELVSLFLQENLDNRKRRAADATSFLNEEAERISGRMDELHMQLATFKEKNLNDLPELAAINIQLLNRSEDEIREIDARIRALDQQLVYLDAQLVQISPTSQVYTSTGERVLSPSDRLKFLRTEYARASALYAPTHPDVVRMQREIAGLEADIGAVDKANDLERQLRDADSKLMAARKRYAADHPDVVRYERMVTSLTQQLSDARSTPSVPNQAAREPDNPAYIQVSAQRKALDAEREALRVKRTEMEGRLREFERRLEKTPGVEREYTALTRELENSQLKYREVRQKQMEAQVAQNLEEERKGERFTLIEPPMVPGEPASPNRKLILMLGLVLSFAGGVGLGLLLDATDSSVRNKRDLESILAVAPLAVVPWIDTADDLQRRVRVRRFSLAGAVGTLVIAFPMVHFFYRPLDVLWEVVLRRLA